MSRNLVVEISLCLVAAVAAGGCQSPYRSDQGALFGGLVGAGTGAIVGDAVGNAGAGTAIGAGIGALTGAAVGSELDNIEAQNRAAIAQQLGRQVSASAVTFSDVVAMSQAEVDDELIVNHIRAHGVASPLTSSDLIRLQQQGVSTRVIKAMQSPPVPAAQPVIVRETPPAPVIVEEYHYGPPVWGPGHCYPHHRRRHCPPPRIGWGMSFHN